MNQKNTCGVRARASDRTAGSRRAGRPRRRGPRPARWWTGRGGSRRTGCRRAGRRRRRRAAPGAARSARGDAASSRPTPRRGRWRSRPARRRSPPRRRRRARRSTRAGRRLQPRLGGSETGEHVGELGLLLEVGQLLIVELVAAGGDRLQLVHQRLGLPWRGDRAQLRLEACALGGQRLAVALEGVDGHLQLVLRSPSPPPVVRRCSASAAPFSAAVTRSGRLARRWMSWSAVVSRRCSSSRSSVSTG